MLKGLHRFFDGILGVLNYISVIAILLTAVWIFGDVVGRFVFRHPIPGTTELVKTGILTIVFLGVTYTLKKDGHVRTTVLLSHLSARTQSVLKMLGAILGIIAFALLAAYGWEAAMKAWDVREFEGVQVRVPTYPSRFIVVLGSVLMTIQYLIIAIQEARKVTTENRAAA